MNSSKVESGQFSPPSHLSARSQAIWRVVVPLYARSTSKLTLIQLALECLDRADSARVAVDAQGLTVKTLATGSIHVHPLLRVESDSRRQFAKLWSGMGLSHVITDKMPEERHWSRRPDLGLPTID